MQHPKEINCIFGVFSTESFKHEQDLYILTANIGKTAFCCYHVSWDRIYPLTLCPLRQNLRFCHLSHRERQGGGVSNVSYLALPTGELSP